MRADISNETGALDRAVSGGWGRRHGGSFSESEAGCPLEPAGAGGKPRGRGRQHRHRCGGESSPDGYTLLITTNGLAISPSLYRKLPFDPIKDFAAVTQLTASYLALAVNPKLGVQSAKELVDLAKAKPGSISYGSTGMGVAPHLVMELFKAATGTDMLHVPYKGDAQVGPALVSGEVQAAFLPPSAIVGHVKAGRLRALAVTSAERASALPDVPGIIEAGLPESRICRMARHPRTDANAA